MGLEERLEENGSVLENEKTRKPSSYLNFLFTSGRALSQTSNGIISSKQPQEAPAPIQLPDHLLKEDGFSILYENGGLILI